MRERLSEQRKQPIAKFFGHVTTHIHDRRRGSIEIGADQVTPLLGIKLRGNAGRTHKIAEHDREIATLANGVG